MARGGLLKFQVHLWDPLLFLSRSPLQSVAPPSRTSLRGKGATVGFLSDFSQ